MSRSERFCFTINNYSDEVIEWFEDTDCFKYVCYGKEVGESLTPHLQGYFEFEHGSKKSIKACLNTLDEYDCPCKPHLEIAQGNAQQCIDYCQKDGVFWEKGERPKGRGKRTDLDNAASIITNGGTIKDVAEAHPVVFIKFHRGLRELQLIKSNQRNWKTEIYWLWGPSGSRKSQWAWTTNPEAYPKQSNTKWWCGYMGQDIAIIDDFRPSKEMPFNFILNLFDRYPLLLETKGGQVQCLLKKIYLTTPLSPQQILSNLEWVGEEQKEQLMRRIDHVIEFPQLASIYLMKN